MDKANDERIEKEIKTILESELRGASNGIRIQCRDGYVTLAGFVDVLSEKNAAGELSERIEGIKSIENCLTISTDGTFSDKEAEAEIIKKFKGNPDITSVSPKVLRGTAVLEGTVKTLKHKNQAIHQASKALGVKDIVSHIEIESLNQIDDVSLHNSIEKNLMDNALDRCHIEVDVKNGSVNLSGFVNNLHDMETAMEIVEGIEGVRNIKNFIKIRE